MNFTKTIAILAMTCLAVTGCGEPKAVTSGDTHVHADGTVHGNHDAGHHDDGEGSHASDAHLPHGENGGHIFAFDSDYKGEWSSSRTDDLVRIYLLDAEGKEAAPVNATVIVTRKDESEFQLDPENPDADGKSNIYVLDNSDLSIAMNLGVTINLIIGDKTHSAELKPSKPHKH